MSTDNATPNDDSTTLPRPEPKTGLTWLIRAGLFMLIGMMILIYIGRDTSTIVNSPMPELDLTPLHLADSKPTNESLKGKVVVYHFWGTWCPPCRIEYPEFHEVYVGYRDNKNVEFISVSCEAGSEPLDSLKSSTIEYLEQINAPMPVYADPAVFTRAKVTQMLSAGGFVYPCTLLVDQKGVVRYLWRGYSENGMSQLKSRIDALLKQNPT